MLDKKQNSRPIVQPWTIVACVMLGLSLSRNIDFLSGLPPFHVHFVSIIHLTVILIVGHRITLYFWRKNITSLPNKYALGRFVFNSIYQGLRDIGASALVYGLAVSLNQAWFFFLLMTVLFSLLLADSFAQAAALLRGRPGTLYPLFVLVFPDTYMVLIGAYMATRGKAIEGMYAVVLGYTIMTAVFDVLNRPRVLNRLFKERKYFNDREHFSESTVRGVE